MHKNQSKTTIKVCHGHACLKSFSNYTFERAQRELKIEDSDGGETKDGKFKLEKCACQGQCAKGPNVVIEREGKKEVHNRMSSQEMGNYLRKRK